jgi:hypothetical protein
MFLFKKKKYNQTNKPHVLVSVRIKIEKTAAATTSTTRTNTLDACTHLLALLAQPNLVPSPRGEALAAPSQLPLSADLGPREVSAQQALACPADPPPVLLSPTQAAPDWAFSPATVEGPKGYFLELHSYHPHHHPSSP